MRNYGATLYNISAIDSPPVIGALEVHQFIRVRFLSFRLSMTQIYSRHATSIHHLPYPSIRGKRKRSLIVGCCPVIKRDF